MRDRIHLILDLLLGAAHADGTLKGSEAVAVRHLITDLLLTNVLPRELEERIAAFPQRAFDLDATAAHFAEDDPFVKRRLLELVALVKDVDGRADPAEDAYLRQLGHAMGMAEDDYADLVSAPDVDELRQSFEHVRTGTLPVLPD